MEINKHKHIYIGLGVAVMAFSVIILGIFGLRLGIDFTGGALTEAVYETVPAQTEVESTINSIGLAGTSIRTTTGTEGRSGYMVRTPDLSEEERVLLTEELTALGEKGEITRFTSIGPVIGQELADKAVWAIGGIALIIILYIAIAFSGVGYPVRSWVYGGITVFALLHDVLVPTAVMSILGVLAGVEVDVLFVTAILAVLGYSVNDTIVVFDRVRENLKQYRNEEVVEVKDVTGAMRKETKYSLTKPFAKIVDLSVSQTLTRSINTSLTTFLALLALYFVGGVTTQTFALILMVGVLAGTYSSLFLANPLLIYYAQKRLGLDVESAADSNGADSSAPKAEASNFTPSH